jgi:hypothetical protein
LEELDQEAVLSTLFNSKPSAALEKRLSRCARNNNPSLVSSNEMKNLDVPEHYPNSHVDAKWESDYRAVDDAAHRTPVESMF